MDKAAKILLLVWIVCIGSLILLGFGSDNDSWRLARAAEKIWSERAYVPSRSTGFPIYELLLAPLVHFGGWYLSNLFSLLSAALLLMGILRLSRGDGALRHAWVVLAAFALNPHLVVNSTSTIDYIPALALLLWSYVLMLGRRYYLAALLVGVSVGFRPTSGLFIVPVVAYLLADGEKMGVATSVVLLALFAGTIACLPALLTLGLPHVGPPAGFSLRNRVLMGGYNGLALLGIPQSLLVYPLLLYHMVRRRLPGPIGLFHVANMVLWLALFAALPMETEYLLPFFMSLVLLLDTFLSRRVFVVVLLLLASLNIVQIDVLGGTSGMRRLEVSLRPGLTVLDVRDRLFKLSTRRAATDYRAKLPTVLMYGEPWIPTLNESWVYDEGLGMYRQKDGSLYVSRRILDGARMDELLARGFRLVAWKGALWEYYMQGKEELLDRVEVAVDLESFFGVSLRGKALSDRL